jgi:Zn-dependent protease with chaperone function
MRLSITVFVAISLVCAVAAGQTRPVLQIPPGAQAGPGFDAQTATNAYLATWSGKKRARSDAYFEGGYWLILWDFLYGAGVLLFLLWSGLSARMRDLAERATRMRAFQTFIYWVEFGAALWVLGLPLSIYEGYVRERQYDLMNQTFGAWLGDELKSLALLAGLGGLAMMALFGVVRRLPRTWHIWGAVVTICLLAFGVLIAPVFIAPMFNTYTPLEDPRIVTPILSLARASGIPATRVYEVNASRQSKRISANVSGFLGTERITLNDNLLNRCSPEAILSVMGHEMGHYVLHHIYNALLFFLVVVTIFFGLLRRALDWSLARWGQRWRIRGIGDVAVIPLAALWLTIFGFVFTPVNNTFIRTQEYEADIYGLNAARQPDGEAEADLLLGEYRKLDPSPLEEFLFFDHPSGRTRIYAAMRWKAENQCLVSPANPCRK